MKIGSREFDVKNGVYIMGILNVTPDSFSDGGKFSGLDKALFRVEEMISEGAAIIDVGGESTRPAHVQISSEEEISRVYDILSGIKARFEVPLSLDSYKSDVIAANLVHIDLVNDIWGLKYDDNMAPLIAKSGLPCCLMHNRKEGNYDDFFPDVLEDFRETLAIAEKAGIEKEKIILDGGVGFAKNLEQNLTVIHRNREINALGCPTLLGVSRKSVIGLTLDVPIEERLSGTLATTAVAVQQGATFIRVHDIKENYQVMQMTKSIMEEEKWTK